MQRWVEEDKERVAKFTALANVCAVILGASAGAEANARRRVAKEAASIRAQMRGETYPNVPGTENGTACAMPFNHLTV